MIIDAIIDEQGNVVQAHVVSGPGLLLASALEAVQRWKYEPTRSRMVNRSQSRCT